MLTHRGGQGRQSVKPDHRLIRTGGTVIPEEWKSARVLRPYHRAQMGVYFLLIEAEMSIWSPHGFMVLGDGTRRRILELIFDGPEGSSTVTVTGKGLDQELLPGIESNKVEWIQELSELDAASGPRRK